MNQRKKYIIAFIVSLLMHLVILLAYKPLMVISRLADLVEAASPAAAQTFEPLEFELVETPAEAEVEQPPEDAQALSDRNARAQDMNQDNSLEEGLPFSQGETEYKLFAGGAPAATQPPWPTDDVPQQGEDTDQDQPLEEGEDEPVIGDVQVFSQARRPQQKQRFSKEMLLGSGNNNANSRGDFSDDATFDNQKFTAEALGGVSLSTYAWDFAPYIFYMKKRLRDHIYPPPAFYQMGMINGEVVLRFKLFPNGSVADLELLEYKGHKALTETSLNAVKASSPFKPLPEGFPENYLELTWTFIYSIFR